MAIYLTPDVLLHAAAGSVRSALPAMASPIPAGCALDLAATTLRPAPLASLVAPAGWREMGMKRVSRQLDLRSGHEDGCIVAFAGRLVTTNNFNHMGRTACSPPV